MPKYRRSRLVRKEDARSLRRAVIFGFLTVFLALTLVFLGVPALIRLAVFIGEIKSSSQPIESKDTVPPLPPMIEALPEATNSAQIFIKGSAEPGSIIKLQISGSSTKEGVTENNGNFSFNDVALSEGKNELTFVAVDQSGNSSQEPRRIEISFDNSPPELIINQPNDSFSYSRSEKKLLINGLTEAKATVTINDRIVIVDFAGNFEHTLNLIEGENLIKVVSTDKAGNSTAKEIKVNYSP